MVMPIAKYSILQKDRAHIQPKPRKDGLFVCKWCGDQKKIRGVTPAGVERASEIIWFYHFLVKLFFFLLIPHLYPENI